MNELDLDELLNEVSNISETDNTDSTDSTDENTIESKDKTEILENVMHKYKIQEIQKEADKTEDSSKYLDEYIEEVQDSIRRYLSERHRINEEIKNLKNELKDLKDEMKEEGIKVTAVDKAFKEMVSELKEDSNDAIFIESVKNMIKKDPSLYGMVREEAS